MPATHRCNLCRDSGLDPASVAPDYQPCPECKGVVAIPEPPPPLMWPELLAGIITPAQIEEGWTVSEPMPISGNPTMFIIEGVTESTIAPPAVPAAETDEDGDEVQEATDEYHPPEMGENGGG